MAELPKAKIDQAAKPADPVGFERCRTQSEAEQ